MTNDDKVTAACVTAVIVAAVAILAWPLYPFSLPSGKDWVDLLGPISTAAAMLVGAGAIYWQVGRQHAKDAEQVLAEQVRRLSLMASGLFHCRALCEQIQTQTEIGGPIWEQRAALKRQAELLSTIPVLDIPDWRAAYAVSDVGLIVSKLMVDIADRDEVDHRSADTIRRWREEHLNVAENNLRVAEGVLRCTLRERGADVPKQTVTHNGIAYSSAPIEDEQREVKTADLLARLETI